MAGETRGELVEAIARVAREGAVALAGRNEQVFWEGRFFSRAVQSNEIMGNLTVHLQDRFIDCCPPGWVAHREVRLLSLNSNSGSAIRPARMCCWSKRTERRLWIEFEVSRADPVANHAKFATTHLFFPQQPGDVFVSMVSAHVVRGRRIWPPIPSPLMRRLGMAAFKPPCCLRAPGSDQTSQSLDLAQLKRDPLDVSLELERVLLLSEPLHDMGRYRLHFVGNLLEVMLNLRGGMLKSPLRKVAGYGAGARSPTSFTIPTAALSPVEVLRLSGGPQTA